MERILKKEAARRGYWHRMTRNLKHQVNELENIVYINRRNLRDLNTKLEKLENKNKTLTDQINFYTKKLDILHSNSKKNANPDLINQGKTSKLSNSEKQQNNPKKYMKPQTPNKGKTSNGKHQGNIPRKKRRRKPKKLE